MLDPARAGGGVDESLGPNGEEPRVGGPVAELSIKIVSPGDVRKRLRFASSGHENGCARCFESRKRLRSLVLTTKNARSQGF